MANPTVREMVVDAVKADPSVGEVAKAYLLANGYDGLFFSGECGCKADDLATCEGTIEDCEAGYLHETPDGFGCDWMIKRDKPENGNGDLIGAAEAEQLRDRYQRLVDAAKAQRAALVAYWYAARPDGGGGVLAAQEAFLKADQALAEALEAA